jgi:hypothetical protein
MLAENDAARLELHLFSEAEQRLPHAARQKFFTQRLREYFEWHKLDLALYDSSLPSGSVVQGPAPLIDFLRRKLYVQP